MPPVSWPREKVVVALTLFVALAVLALDLSLPLGVAGGVPYVALVLIALWAPWRSYIFYMAGLGTLLTIIGYFASPAGGITWVVLSNRGLAVFAIWVTAILCDRIRQDDANLRAIFDTAGDGIISIDEQGVIRSFNQAAANMFGYTRDEVLGRDVSMLMPEPERAQHDDYLNRYLQTNVATILGVGRRLQAQHKDGHHFPIYLNVGKVRRGRHTTFTGIIHDLSGEEAREAQLQQLWYAVEQSPISIIITNANGDIEYVNPCFSRLTGYRPEEVLGENPRILKSGNTQAGAYRHLWQTITSDRIWRGVLQNRKKSGELYWISSTLCPVRDQGGDINHFIAFNEDITHLREQEEMLTQAMKLEAVGRMTDGIAHDFRNLLTIILGNLQLLQEDINQRDEALVADALSAAQDGSELIMRLLAFSRRKEQAIVATDINASLTELLRLLRRTLPENVAINLSLTEETATVQVDPNRLESTILNLVTNAQDAMPAGGALDISTGREVIVESRMAQGEQIAPGSYVTISVADTGTGMDENVRRHVLEPFYSTKGSGTGLGLSMVADFIKDSGGGIAIKSVPGRGTTITLLLPVADATDEKDEWTEDEDLPEILPAGNETVLLVEDSAKVRRFAARILTRLGYALVEADSAGQALKQLHNHKGIDLLFTDIVMPGELDGRELARRAGDQQPSLKVLLTTGMEHRSEDGGNIPMKFPLLPKPYTAKQLAYSIRNVLDTGKLNK